MNKFYKPTPMRREIKTSWITVMGLVVIAILIAGVFINFTVKTLHTANLSLVRPANAQELCGLDSVECGEETPEDIIRELGGERTEYLLALAMCESSMRPDVRGTVDKRDRGLFQINSRWNPDVTDECAFDVRCSTLWVISELKKGNSWKWVCHNKII